MKNQSETQKNRQTKTQSETQHRNTDEQIKSEQTPRVTPSEWQAVAQYVGIIFFLLECIFYVC
jgi:hypothetical protein